LGATAQVGQILMIFVPEHKWVTANFKETQLTLMRPGQPVDIGIDAHTPCLAVSNASTPQQHIHRTTLAALDDDAVGPAPVLMLIGHAIR